MLNFKKTYLIPVAIVLIFISLWTYFFWYPDLVMDQQIEELRTEGIDVEVVVYDIYYAEMTATSPEVVFDEKVSWSAFKQDVMTVKTALGSVTVSVDREQRIFVFPWNETTHYYYQVT